MSRLIKFITSIVFIAFISINTAHSQNKIPAYNAKGKNARNMVFLFQQNGKSETLIITFINSQTISFEIVSFDKNTGKRAALDGIAKMPAGAIDPEVDGDENGQAYFVDEFIFDKKCGLTIRIDGEKKDKAKIYESECMRKKNIISYNVSFDCRKVMKIKK